MKKFHSFICISLLLIVGTLAVKAGSYLQKPKLNWATNSVMKTGATSDAPTVITTITESEAGIVNIPQLTVQNTLVANGASFTTNGTSLTKANAITLSNGNACTTTMKGNSANQVAVISCTRFYLPALKTSGGGQQANGALLATMPAGAQAIFGPALNTFKLFTANGAVAIKANGAVLALGSVKAGGAVDNLAGTATFTDILTGQQVQPNGRTLNAIGVGTYATAIGGVKTIYVNYANGFPAVPNGTLWINGTIAIPINNKY